MIVIVTVQSIGEVCVCALNIGLPHIRTNCPDFISLFLCKSDLTQFVNTILCASLNDFQNNSGLFVRQNTDIVMPLLNCLFVNTQVIITVIAASARKS